MIKDFKKFILRGNAVDLAVAVVIGAAFGAIVTSVVKGLITPLIGLIGGQPDFSDYKFTVNDTKFLVGDVLNAIISFLLIAAVIFFLVIQPINKLMARMQKGEESPEPTTRKCPECVSEIPKAARRCAYCTAKIEAITD